MKPAAVRAYDLEGEAVHRHLLAALGHAAEMLQHEPADRVELLVAEGSAELIVEIADLGDRLDAVLAGAVLHDVVFDLVEVVLVLDVADDLLEHVLDRDETGD